MIEQEEVRWFRVRIKLGLPVPDRLGPAVRHAYRNGQEVWARQCHYLFGKSILGETTYIEVYAPGRPSHALRPEESTKYLEADREKGELVYASDEQQEKLGRSYEIHAPGPR